MIRIEAKHHEAEDEGRRTKEKDANLIKYGLIKEAKFTIVLLKMVKK